MKKIILVFLFCAMSVIAQEGLTLKSIYFYKTNDFVYQSPKDTIETVSKISFQNDDETIVIQNKYQTTRYKVLDSYKNGTNIIIHVVRLDSNNQYNIIMSDNTIELVCISSNDGNRVVFVLKENKNNFF